MKWIVLLSLIVGCGLFWSACRRAGSSVPNQKLAPKVDIDLFMGKWYVHGYTPTSLDPDAYDATETYELGDDGKILTTYRFRKSATAEKWKVYHPKGWVVNEETGSEWRMRFFGLFTAPYYILYVDHEHAETVVGHPDKDMAWIMTRSSEIAEADYERLKQELVERAYDLAKLQRVAHADAPP